MSNELLSQTYPKSDTLNATISTWSKDADCAQWGRIHLGFTSPDYRSAHSIRLTIEDAEALVEHLQGALTTCRVDDVEEVPA